MSNASWLPELIEFDGNWSRYVDTIYDRFREDFVEAPLWLEGKRIRLPSRTPELGKDPTFWHLTSEGAVEQTRTPDFRRCERMSWPRAVIEAAGRDRVQLWRVRRGKHKRVLIALADFSYLVVLEERATSMLVVTAYPIDRQHERRRLERECRQAQAKN